MGCNLKTLGYCFSSRFSIFSWENRQKLTMVCSPFEKIIRFPSVDVLGVFHVPGKVFNLDLDFSIFFIPKRKNALDRIPQKY